MTEEELPSSQTALTNQNVANAEPTHSANQNLLAGGRNCRLSQGSHRPVGTTQTRELQMCGRSLGGRGGAYTHTTTERQLCDV